jgi:hypothetical protein
MLFVRILGLLLRLEPMILLTLMHKQQLLTPQKQLLLHHNNVRSGMPLVKGRKYAQELELEYLLLPQHGESVIKQRLQLQHLVLKQAGHVKREMLKRDRLKKINLRNK